MERWPENARWLVESAETKSGSNSLSRMDPSPPNDEVVQGPQFTSHYQLHQPLYSLDFFLVVP